MRNKRDDDLGARPAKASLATFAAETTARPDVVRRVRSRLVPADDAAAYTTLLSALPSAAPGAAARVRARLQRPARRALLPVFAFGGVALAAVGLLLAWLLPNASPPLAATLDAPTEWQGFSPTTEVALDFQGKGTLAGTAGAPRLAWDSGTLKVEVEPDRGIDLQVVTREAEVRVVGTGFSVTRDALGTAVAVAHGHVAVICADGGKSLLGTGESTTCAPTQPAALLGRARALAEQGAGPEDVLRAADQGLAAGATGAVASELVLVRVEALTRLGRAVEALAAAEAGLASDPARPLELRHLAVRNALASAGCVAALPHLEALVASGASGPELVHYADCVSDTEPEAARRALTSALRLAPADQETGIIERLTRLRAR